MNGRLKADTRGTMSADRTPQVRPRWYRVALTTHIVLAVGALGVEAAVLFLTLTGLSSSDADLVKAAYLVLDRIAPYLLVPLAIAALLSGLVMATAGGWGLSRYYWIMTKLGLTLVAALALIFSLRPALGRAAEAARSRPLAELPSQGVGSVGVVVTIASAAALVILIAIATLGVTKPWGSRHGRR